MVKIRSKCSLKYRYTEVISHIHITRLTSESLHSAQETRYADMTLVSDGINCHKLAEAHMVPEPDAAANSAAAQSVGYLKGLRESAESAAKYGIIIESCAQVFI